MITYRRLVDTTSIQVKEVSDFLNKYVSFGLASEESVRAIMEKGKIYLAILKEEDKQTLVGVITMSTKDTYSEIMHIATDSNHRRKGIAGSLMDLALSEMRIKQPINITGWVTPNGWEAENLVVQRGFQILAEIQDAWGSMCHSEDDCPYYTQRCNCSTKIAQKAYN